MRSVWAFLFGVRTNFPRARIAARSSRDPKKYFKPVYLSNTRLSIIDTAPMPRSVNVNRADISMSLVLSGIS